MIAVITPEYVEHLTLLELYIRPVQFTALIMLSESYELSTANALLFQNFTRNIYHLDTVLDSEEVVLNIFCPNTTIADPWKTGVNIWTDQYNDPIFKLDLNPAKYCIHPARGKSLKAYFGYVPGFVIKSDDKEVDGFEPNTLRYT